MTISYHWLNDYLPVVLEPEKLSKILTSIGLEVETLHPYEEVPGSLRGLVTGQVMECIPHPDADKLKLTRVDTGTGTLLQIVCGAPNVAIGQRVVVATPGTTIHPLQGEPLTMKVAKIRGVESQGMLCAEDELGLGNSHAGIIVLPENTPVGIPAAEVFKPYTDWIYEIGLTPNRMDAMSHLGVARDVCAYLTHHERQSYTVRSPFQSVLSVDDHSLPIRVTVANTQACKRYCGVSLTGIRTGPSPVWMQQRLKAIGVRPISNIVDITNYLLHETGQPLHAFDAARITGNEIIVKNLPEGTPFVTLDGKERKLSAEDLMVCNALEGMAIGGVFGGKDSGISEQTSAIFLESAWFEPVGIRKTSLRHGLRTDAAVRFEKGVDISGAPAVLKRAAQLIREIAGGKVSSQIVDVYPQPEAQVQVSLRFHYLKKLSGKNYHPDTVKNILVSLGFGLTRETIDEITVSVPYSKTDIHLPADLVEEVMRIDGLDNIEIPEAIRISPSVEADRTSFVLKEKMAGYLVGVGFNEILTNSISNSAYFSSYADDRKVRLLNNLSTELDMLRPSMLETGLEAVAYNLNHKNLHLRMFEFGKSYQQKPGEPATADRLSEASPTPYNEADHLCLYMTGQVREDSWRQEGGKTDFYYAKGLTESLLRMSGLAPLIQQAGRSPELSESIVYSYKDQPVARAGQVSKQVTDGFDIRQPVFFADIDWNQVTHIFGKQAILYKEVARSPAVQRDLALVVGESVPYARIEQVAFQSKIRKLRSVALFDIFRSDKLGEGKKSVALSFTFQDEEKTLTDKEIDGMMQQLIRAFETELPAEIRK
jgi:phenylalanyl-tRNA synthetase beta chain